MSPMESGSGLIPIAEGQIIFKYLTNNGTQDMAVDGSVTPVLFSYGPPAGQRLIIGSINVTLKGNLDFDVEKFAYIPALTNGVSILQNGTEIINWKTIRDMTLTFTDYNYLPVAEEKSIYGRILFARIVGGIDGIEIKAGNTFGLLIQDDLSGENLEFHAVVHGVLVG